MALKELVIETLCFFQFLLVVLFIIFSVHSLNLGFVSSQVTSEYIIVVIRRWGVITMCLLSKSFHGQNSIKKESSSPCRRAERRYCIAKSLLILELTA